MSGLNKKRTNYVKYQKYNGIMYDPIRASSNLYGGTVNETKV